MERALSQLLVRELKLHLTVENLKRTLEISYDYSIANAFKCIDDWNFGYLDHKNIRRFLRNMGYLASQQELVAMIRRFDLDGDAKINKNEFKDGIKSMMAKTKNDKSMIQSSRSKHSTPVKSETKVNLSV